MSSPEATTVETTETKKRHRGIGFTICSEISLFLTIIELLFGIALCGTAVYFRLPAYYAILGLGYTLISMFSLGTWIYAVKIAPRKLAKMEPRELVSHIMETFQTIYRIHHRKIAEILLGLFLLVLLPLANALAYPYYPTICTTLLAFYVIACIIVVIAMQVKFMHELPIFTPVHKVYEIVQLSIAILTLEVAVIEHVVPVMIIGSLMVLISLISLISAVVRHRFMIRAMVPTEEIAV